MTLTPDVKAEYVQTTRSALKLESAHTSRLATFVLAKDALLFHTLDAEQEEASAEWQIMWCVTAIVVDLVNDGLSHDEALTEALSVLNDATEGPWGDAWERIIETERKASEGNQP